MSQIKVRISESKIRNPDGSRHKVYGIEPIGHVLVVHPMHSSKTAIMKIIKSNNYKLVK